MGQNVNYEQIDKFLKEYDEYLEEIDNELIRFGKIY